MVAEESAAAGKLPDISGGVFFLVDPLDGTKEFLNKNGEFTVNIALIEQGHPTAGVVFAPAVDRLFWGSGAGAFEETAGKMRQIKTRVAPAEGHDRHREPQPSRPPDRRVSGPLPHREPDRRRLLAEVLRDRSTAKPTSTRAMDPRWNGTPPQVTPCCARPAAASPASTARRYFTYGNAREKFQNPSFIAWGR